MVLFVFSFSFACTSETCGAPHTAATSLSCKSALEAALSCVIFDLGPLKLCVPRRCLCRGRLLCLGNVFAFCISSPLQVQISSQRHEQSIDRYIHTYICVYGPIYTLSIRLPFHLSFTPLPRLSSYRRACSGARFYPPTLGAAKTPDIYLWWWWWGLMRVHHRESSITLTKNKRLLSTHNEQAN